MFADIRTEETGAAGDERARVVVFHNRSIFEDGNNVLISKNFTNNRAIVFHFEHMIWQETVKPIIFEKLPEISKKCTRRNIHFIKLKVNCFYLSLIN